MTIADPDHGITVTEISPMDQPIQWRNDSTAAFIGRALRGPLNTPLLIQSVGEFTRRFGGRWKRSGLFDAVEQFFLHGGKRLYVVRVANNAFGSTLKLPTADVELQLRAREPGTTEVLRASVDYDGINDDEHFNLTVQRLSPETRLVLDQEIFGGISCDRSAAAFIGDALDDSALVELRDPLPASRPLATMGPEAHARAPYILPALRGSDGHELSDYDIVGSAVRGTGLFSLEAVDDLDLIYLPPLAPQRDAGLAAILAAELYCRRRGALLIIDPAADWQDAEAAANGVEAAGLSSAHVVSYFPRLLAANGVRPAGGALAGLLCKLDAQQGPWGSLAATGYAFSRGLRPQQALGESEQQLLLRSGLNVITGGADGRQILAGGITLANGRQSGALSTNLAVKRFSMKLARTIERATRWAVFEDNRALAANRVERQVEELLHLLAQRRALYAAFVRCETCHDVPEPSHERGLALMLMLQCAITPEPISMTLYQTASGCRVASTAFAPVAPLQSRGSSAA
ncbi:MAG: hypothetical protein WBM68_04845 [Woeseia sp.]